MNIALLKNKTVKDIPHTLKNEFGNITAFNSVIELSKNESAFDAVFIIDFPQDAVFLLIQQIRKSETLYNIPAFIDKLNLSKYLSDGCFLEVSETKNTIAKIQKISKDLSNTNNQAKNWKTKFLSFLYCRPEIKLVPDFSREKAMYYYYPLIELFYTGKENYFYWLDDLTDQNILKKEKLLDRLFCCPYCFSAHLKFTDHCPYCNSINIRLGDFLHCFTCGLVAPQEDFMKNDRLICPRCNSHLLHIGEDYDRPLESGVCLDCGEYHVDSKVISYCIDCKKSVQTDNLNKRAIYELSLSEIGLNQIRFNSIDLKPIFEDSLKFVIMDYFYFVTDWFRDMQKRYKDEVFSIIGIKMIFESTEASYELSIEFAKLIKKIFRTTDFCTRSSSGYFWFLLRKTNKEKINIIKNRINKFIDELEKDEKDNFKVKLVDYTSNQKNVDKTTGKILISELSSHLQ